MQPMEDVSGSGLDFLYGVLVFQIYKILIGRIPIRNHHFKTVSINIMEIDTLLTGRAFRFPQFHAPLIFCIAAAILFSIMITLYELRLRMASTVGFAVIVKPGIVMISVTVRIRGNFSTYPHTGPGGRRRIHIRLIQAPAQLAGIKAL